MRKSPSPAQREAVTNPLVAAATLMVDVHEDGSVSCVVGSMDMSSRRYVFSRVEVEPLYPYRKEQLAAAVCMCGSEYLAQYLRTKE